jgi:hypothetical protein
MEVGRGLVYPCQTMLDDLQINTSSYAVVKVDMVHDNSKDLKLEVPLDDTMLTMWDVVARRVQWRQTSIVIASSVSNSRVVASNYRKAAEVSNSRSATSVFNSRAATEVSTWRAASSVSTSHSEFPAPYTWSVAGKGDEECMCQKSPSAVEDVIEGNKGQETTKRVES